MFCPLLRDEARLALLHGGDGGLREFRGVAIPLNGQQRLDGHAGAVAVRDLVRVGLGALQELQPLQLGDDGGARGVATLPGERLHERRVGHAVHRAQLALDLAERHPRLAVEHARHGQAMALAHLEVVEVMRGRDLDGARALLRIGILVRDDRDAPADQGQDRVLAYEVVVARVVGVDGDGGVPEQGFGPGRGHGDEPARLALDGVADVPEVPAHLALLYFEVADRRPQLRVPVDQAAVAVDQALAVERDEHLAHGTRQALVHGEALARPVERGADAAELPGDRAARFRLPLPDAVEERLAAHRLA